MDIGYIDRSAAEARAEKENIIATLRADKGEDFANAVADLSVMLMSGNTILRIIPNQNDPIASVILGSIARDCVASMTVTVCELIEKANNLTTEQVHEALDKAKTIADNLFAKADAAVAISRAKRPGDDRMN